MNWIIRPFDASDFPAMQAVRRAAFAPIFQSFQQIVGEQIYAIALADADREQEALLESLCEPASPWQLFVATLGDRIVGFVSFSLDTQKRVGEIGLNAVHPEYAGQGIGTGMYEFVLARMKESEMVAAAVGTGGDPSHASARRAYEKAGFVRAIPSLYLYRTL